jgi:acetylornithine deacetylase/succinyl-diaminopimelate desuccinylase-like protein
MQDVITYLRAHHDAHLATLVEWLKIPSISADPAYNPQTAAAANFIAEHIEKIGLTSIQRLPTAGQDVIYGEWLGAPGQPTILVYGHYDVQPPDPLALWKSPPFEPVIRDGHIHARGANDNKGQLMLILNAIEAWLATKKRLPINIKCCIEGDEESGPAGAAAIQANPELLSCDAIVIADTPWLDADTPTVLYGARGSAFCEITVRGPQSDLHSGLYGGLVVNPALVLCEVMGKAKDADGVIQIPGFYDGVAPPSAAEQANLDAHPVKVSQVQADTGVPALMPPEPGLSHRAMSTMRPTFDIVGMTSGYTGEGQKTIIPAEARAKVSCRLVTGQDPTRFARAMEAFCAAHMPPEVTWECRVEKAAPAWSNDPEDPYIQRAAQVAQRVFGKKTAIMREGASIPIVSTMMEVLKVPVVLLGMGLPSDGIHSPFEKFRVEQYQKGAECYAQLFAEYGK